jgi:hypothetical protein
MSSARVTSSRLGGRAVGRAAAAWRVLALLALLAPAATATASEHHGPGLYLAMGGAASDVGAVGLVEVGFWFGPVLPTIIYRGTASGSRGRTEFIGGRLDLGYWPTDWLSLHAGAGGGSLDFKGTLANGSPSAHRAAAVVGGTITFGSRDFMNLLGFGVEWLQPIGPRRGDPGPFAAPPVIMFSITVQPLYLYAM